MSPVNIGPPRFCVATAALKAAGLGDGHRFHDLRHTFGTRMAAGGVPMRTLQEWIGHRDIETTQRYADYAPRPHEVDFVAAPFTTRRGNRARRVPDRRQRAPSRVTRMELWTQRLVVAWRPSLGFFEHRYELLRELENRQLLHGFRVTEQRVVVRLRDAMHVLAFAPGRIEVSLLRPDADVARIETALGLLVSAMELRPARVSLATQWLQPLDGVSYREARSRALHAAFPDIPAAETEDFAFLIENKHGREVRWTLDVGIVERDELPPRLARQHSRIGPADQESPPTLWPPESLPEVALYCDGDFDVDQRLDEPNLDALLGTWQSVRKTAEEVVGSVFTKLDPNEEK